MPKFELWVKAHVKVTLEAQTAQQAYEIASDELAGLRVPRNSSHDPVTVEIGHLVALTESKEIE